MILSIKEILLKQEFDLKTPCWFECLFVSLFPFLRHHEQLELCVDITITVSLDVIVRA